MIALMISLALAAQPKPDPRPPGVSECEPVSIRVGYRIPESLLLMGLAGCNGEVVPQSELATLYSVETWADQIDAEYRLDIAALDLEVEFYRSKRDGHVKWSDKPEIQRWMGRLDVIVPVAVAIITMSVIAGVK